MCVSSDNVTEATLCSFDEFWDTVVTAYVLTASPGPVRNCGSADLPFPLMSEHAQQIFNTYLALGLGLGFVLGLILD